MDILSIYICVLATIAGLIFLQQYFNPQPSSRIRHLYNVVTRFIILPYIFRRRKFWGPITVFNLVIHSIFIAGTAVCNIFGASDVDTARQRAGSIALIHLCVLVVVPRSAFGAAFFGISIRTYNQLHRSIGVMAMFQSLLHVLLAIKMKSLDLNDIKERNGFIAIVSIATVSITVIPQLRRHIYEFCIKLHLALGIFGIVMVWMHMKDKYGLNGRLLISAISLFLLNTVYFIIRELYRNVTRTTFMAVANCTPLADAVMLDFIPPRPWKVRAGYYVYLRVPQIHLLSFAETHPFNIIWWEEDKLGKATRVFVVARVQTGFTKRLSGISDQSLRLFADGPYGKPLETALWDNFLFIATDIGISAQLPYLKELIDLQRQPRRLGRVSIVWVVEDDAHRGWVPDELSYLLDLDKGNLVFYWTTYSKTEIETTQVGRRGRMVFGSPDIKVVLEEELRKFSGKVMLSVSANPGTRDECRKFCSSRGGQVGYFEHEHQPPNRSQGLFTTQRNIPVVV